ncbi:hypothetical protein Ark11_1393 [Candidatus Ichthyocystis hellenicum]|uniref:Uncharacterized protein n=2 Tax=Candidatus Ichthyocystis hellenicum TaxID=1561003 RepID=A0A0S4M5K3_9BURK|nr:hypothetical protein Ark11_1393 [Candidatus Ichthyocystis hellenicum]
MPRSTGSCFLQPMPIEDASSSSPQAMLRGLLFLLYSLCKRYYTSSSLQPMTRVDIAHVEDGFERGV